MNKILLLTLLFAALLSVSSDDGFLQCKLCKKYEDGRCLTGETNCQGPSRKTTCMRITYFNGTEKTGCVFKGLCEVTRDRIRDPNREILCCQTDFCNKIQPRTPPISTPSDSSPRESP